MLILLISRRTTLIADSASRYGVDGIIRGSLSNVLSRYISMVEKYPCDYIVRVTADNPLTEFGFIEYLVHHISSMVFHMHG